MAARISQQRLIAVSYPTPEEKAEVRRMLELIAMATGKPRYVLLREMVRERCEALDLLRFMEPDAKAAATKRVSRSRKRKSR